jgi:ABC-type Fe3+/spermidine/putrescine transport system ATPase subunit
LNLSVSDNVVFGLKRSKKTKEATEDDVENSVDQA